MKRKKYIKIILILLPIINIIILGLRWIDWQLDYHYGYGYSISSELPIESKYGYEALVSIYANIYADIYYNIFATVLYGVLLLVYHNIKEN